MKNFNTFYKFDCKMNYERFGSRCFVDFSKVFLEYDSENFLRKSRMNIWEEMIRIFHG